MKNRVIFIVGLALIALVLFVAGCAAGLGPQMTYQGRLTDDSGNPLNGSFTMIFRFFHQATGGAAISAETQNDVPVTDGLFDRVLTPTGAGLGPKDLTEPLWLEVTVGNGVITETLAPRQRLYGAPYAFTLMPGTYISASMDSLIYGSNGIDAILTVQNGFEDSVDFKALPALRVSGYTGLELTGGDLTGGADGVIHTDVNDTDSDLFIYTMDNATLQLDRDNNDAFHNFRVLAGGGLTGCTINQDADLSCDGTKSAVVQVEEEARLMYAVESTEVWFEDFGAGVLQDGAATVTVDPLFAATVNLGMDYHVFLTPMGDCNGLYVAKKSANAFEVRELNGGVSGINFDYRIVAKRAGYEDVRMERLDAVEGE